MTGDSGQGAVELETACQSQVTLERNSRPCRDRLTAPLVFPKGAGASSRRGLRTGRAVLGPPRQGLRRRHPGRYEQRREPPVGKPAG